MKKAFFVLFASFFCMQALASELTPYIGFNAQMRYLPFVKNYGHGSFEPKMPQGEMFVGFKVNPYLGFELGYLRSVTRHRTATIKAPVELMGNPDYLSNGGLGFEMANSSSRIDGGSLNVVGFLPIDDEIQLLGSVGIARLRTKLRYIPLSNGGGVLNAAQIREFTSDFVRCEYVPQAKIGIQHMLTSSVGLRALVGWDGTKNFNLMHDKQATKFRVSLKNSYNIGLGLAYYFH